MLVYAYSGKVKGLRKDLRRLSPIINYCRGGVGMTEQLVRLLSNLPQMIADAEQEVILATRELREAEDALAMKEASLITEGQITGKNEMERKAQLLKLTTEERAAVARAQERLSLARLNYNKAVNEFKAARSIAQILGQLNNDDAPFASVHLS